MGGLLNSEGDANDAKAAGQRLQSMSVIAPAGHSTPRANRSDPVTEPPGTAMVSSMGSSAIRYPENTMEFAPDYGDDVPAHWQRFFALREELLLDYGYNTARAYWADLQDWFDWAVAREKDVLALTERDQKQYYALLRRRGYSESTVRRRATSLNLLTARDRPSNTVILNNARGGLHG